MTSGLSPTQATLWREHPQYSTGKLYLLKPDVVYAAQVNLASGALYPVSGIPTDNPTIGAYSDVEAGMLILVGSTPGADDKGRVWAQSDPTSSTLLIPPCSRGTSDGNVDLADNLYVTVLNLRLPRPKTPYIDKPTSTMYKDGNIVVGSNTTTPPPQANAGPWFAGDVDPDTGLLTVPFTAAESFANAYGASIASVVWDLIDGSFQTGGPTDTEIVATFPVGYRYVKLTVTDTNAKTHTCTPLIIASDVDHPPILNFVAQPRHVGASGQQFSFVVRQEILTADYPDGTAVIYVDDEHPDLTDYAPDGRETVKFCGWMDTEPTAITSSQFGAIRTVTLNCLDAVAKLEKMREFPQILRAVASVALWTESTYVDPDMYIWYLLYWHSNLADLVDYLRSGYGSTYPLVALDSDGESLAEQVRQIAEAIGYFFGCDPWGRMVVSPDEMQLPTVTEVATIAGLAGLRARTTEETVSILETDWTGANYVHQRPPKTYWAIGETIIAGAAQALPGFVIGPGAIPGYGESSHTISRQIAVNITELQYRIGKILYMDNANNSLFDVPLAHGVAPEMFFPLINRWVRFQITSATAAQRGEVILSERFLVREVNIGYDALNRHKSPSLRIERETFGQPAEIDVRPDNEANLPTYDNPYDFMPEPEPVDGGPDGYQLFRGITTIALFSSDKSLLRTADFSTPSAQGGPTWERVALTLDGFPVAEIGDAFSPRYLQSGSAVNGWIATSTKMYGIADVFGAAAVTDQYTFLDALGGSLTRTLQFGWQTPNWGIAITYCAGSGGRGVTATYTTDGVNWTELDITPFYDAFPTGHAMGIYVSSTTPGFALTSAWTATVSGGAPSAFYMTLNYGASWTRITSPADYTPGTWSPGCILAPYADNRGEEIVYFGGRAAGNIGFYRKNADGSVTDITPVVDGYGYEPIGTRSFHACPIDRQSIVLCGANNGTVNLGLFVSRDGGDTWTTIAIGPLATMPWLYASIAGDDRNVVYLWGGDGTNLAVGYSQDFCATIDDRSGNIATLASGTAVGLVGG
jgi:hypothetical protein